MRDAARDEEGVEEVEEERQGRVLARLEHGLAARRVAVDHDVDAREERRRHGREVGHVRAKEEVAHEGEAADDDGQDEEEVAEVARRAREGPRQDAQLGLEVRRVQEPHEDEDDVEAVVDVVLRVELEEVVEAHEGLRRLLQARAAVPEVEHVRGERQRAVDVVARVDLEVVAAPLVEVPVEDARDVEDDG